MTLAGPSSLLRSKDPSAPIELILGIKESGSSHLLLTIRDGRRLGYAPRWEPCKTVDFESLSPIYFNEVAELSTKLRSLKNQKGFGSSKANKIYSAPGGSAGVKRGDFEHNRILYKTLHNAIDTDKYSMGNTSWAANLRVCSLTFNLWSADIRKLKDRQSKPRVLDVGFAEANVPSLAFKARPALDFLVAENSALRQAKQTRQVFGHGETVKLHEYEIRDRIRAVLNTATPHNPIVLLVFEKEWATHILKSFDYDLETRPLKALVFKPEVRVGPAYSGGRFESDNGYQRRRSRSPHRRNNSYASSSSTADPRNRRRSPESAQTGDPLPSQLPSECNVYFVDVKQMYCTMKQAAEVDSSPLDIYDIAQGLQVQVAYDPATWCAGNEAVLLQDLWRTMISGTSIDEQRAEWKKVAKAGDYGRDHDRDGDVAASDGGYDSQEDPNGYQEPQKGYPQASATGATIDPDDVSDYGSSEEE
ncbi:hypothetical protein FA15DRAFT_668785 [Coprinopsis marcescibilis]|uniref:Uncharacterized protein n=1 Tax=Coprinopsis marcescibilis TaxID=230819 RepID=A0A5C3LAE6_COPMA|nr:hypothetical protein FA15DRAFT_668785 [Coprinopsis marcescibilis]